MAIIDKKQKRWYSKSTFDSLDKTTIPVGTEIQVAGELGQADFDSDTNTKLNAVPNKLDKPSGNPTEDSVVKVSSTGTVSWEKVGKLYKHRIHAANTIFDLIVINNNSAKITTFTSLLGVNYVSMHVGSPACTPVVELSTIYEGADANIVGIKVGWNLDGLNHTNYLNSNLESDTVTEL